MFITQTRPRPSAVQLGRRAAFPARWLPTPPALLCLLAVGSPAGAAGNNTCTRILASAAGRQGRNAQGPQGQSGHAQLLGILVRALPPGNAAARPDVQALQRSGLHLARRQRRVRYQGCGKVAEGHACVLPGSVRQERTRSASFIQWKPCPVRYSSTARATCKAYLHNRATSSSDEGEYLNQIRVFLVKETG